MKEEMKELMVINVKSNGQKHSCFVVVVKYTIKIKAL